MLSFLDSPCVMWTKWSAVILLMTVLIHGVTSTSDSASTLSLRKCRCNKYQVWDGANCLDSDTENLIPVYDKDLDFQKGEINVSKYGILLPTSNVENVTVMELECPKNLFHATVTENMLLLRDGRLLWLSTMTAFTNENFCVEHFREMGQTYFDAQICLPPPAVPRCCPENHLLGRDGSCHPQEAFQAPPLQLGKHMVNWDQVGGDMVTLTCDEHEYHRHINLRPGEGQLGDTQPTAILEWSSPVWVAFQSWRDKYCVALQEMETGEFQYVAQICFKDHSRYHEHQCNKSVCIRKCCPQDALFSHGMCVEALSDEEVWRPSRIPGQDINDEWKIVSGEPGCHGYPHFGEMHLLPNGFLQLSPESPPVPPSQYCLDNLLNNGENITNFAILCFPSEDTTCLWRDIVIKVMLGLSCVFLMATLAVYLGVAELRDHTSGRCLISMVAAMLTAYLCLLCGTESTSSRASCYTLAFVTHLSSLAMFFWLNVMCFDMWKTLRGSRMQHHSMKEFLWYSLYAWGCPMVVSTVTLILDITAPKNIILPEYFDGSCWFKEDAAYWAYFSGFILLLVLSNVSFFIHVAITLYQRLKQRTQNFETSTSHTNKTMKTKEKAWVFARLFVVMGVVWIADSLSAVGHRKTCSYWVFADIINGLQGVFIFIVAVCNKDNLKKVKDAWRPRVQSMRSTFSSLSGRTSQNTTQITWSTDDTEDSRKTSITSLPRKISQASNIFFSGSSKKTATLNPADSSGNSHSGRKNSNVSIKDVIPLSPMQE